MKITSYEAIALKVPEDDPLANMPEEAGRTRPVVVLRLRTDSGIEGIGVTFYGRMTRSLHTAVEELAALTVGEDPMRIEAIVAKLRATAATRDRAASSPWPCRPSTPRCGTSRARRWTSRCGSCWAAFATACRPMRPARCAAASPTSRRSRRRETLVEKGFRQMKTQMALPGDPTPADEVRRVRVIREAIGPDIKLMCDINQRWRPEQAIDIGHRVEEAGVGLFWLEDVTTADDYQGLARVTAALKTPIAGGEYVYGIPPFRQMIEARSVDIVMIDLARVGGITQWMKVAGMAEAFNLPVVSHVMPEMLLHLVAACPNGLTVEYMPWMLACTRRRRRSRTASSCCRPSPASG